MAIAVFWGRVVGGITYELSSTYVGVNYAVGSCSKSLDSKYLQ